MTMMQDNPMLRDALTNLGGSVGSSLTDNWAFCYVTDFLNVPFGGTQQSTLRVEAGVDFLVQAIMARFNFNANTTPTGYPPRAPIMREIRDALVTATPENYATLDHVLVQITTIDRQWFSGAARASLVTSDPASLMFLPTPVLIAGNDSIITQITNNLPALTGAATPAIDGEVVYMGIRMSRKRK